MTKRAATLAWVATLTLACGTSLAGLERQDTTANAMALERQATAAERSGDLRSALDLFVRAERAFRSLEKFSEAERLEKQILVVAGRLRDLPPLPPAAVDLMDNAFRQLRSAASDDDLEKAWWHALDAILLAPWEPRLRYNQALIAEAAGDVQYEKGNGHAETFYLLATSALEMYLLAQPGDAISVRNKMAQLKEKTFAADQLECRVGQYGTGLKCWSVAREYEQRGDLQQALIYYDRSCKDWSFAPACKAANDVRTKLRGR